jgi:hypothetical protein
MSTQDFRYRSRLRSRPRASLQDEQAHQSTQVRLFFVQPFDQSCWTGVGALGAAFATGVMVARLRTINAARIKYVIEILHLFSRARCPGLTRDMDAFTR